MEILQQYIQWKNSLANLSLTPEKGGETSIGTSRFPLNKLLKQFIIKIVTKIERIREIQADFGGIK